VLETDRLHRADVPEAGRGMQRDRSGVRRITNHRDHLTEAARFGLGDQTCEQQSAEPLALEFWCNVNRILDAPAVGRPSVVGPDISVAGDDPGPLGNEIRKILRQQRFQAPRHFRFRWRFDFERCGTVGDSLAVDAGYGGDIA